MEEVGVVEVEVVVVMVVVVVVVVVVCKRCEAVCTRCVSGV